MCLVLDARDATRDVDVFFKPTKTIREAEAKIAARAGVSSDWFKGFLSPRGDFVPYFP
jgi:hypothetical protein